MTSESDRLQAIKGKLSKIKVSVVGIGKLLGPIEFNDNV
jgi:hypothetical protein